jgi:hypothetical protein
MSGSDLNVVSKNKAALSNTASNAPTTVTIFGGPMRLKGFIIEPTDVSGTLTWKDGGTDVFDIETGNAAAGASTVQINLPAEGIKFKTSIQVSSTIAGANVSTTNGVTAFFA